MRRLVFGIAMLAATACGGSTSGSGTGGTGVGGTGGAGAGGTGASSGAGGGTGATGGAAKNSGECDSDGDCSPGTCVELSPGGYRVCKDPVQEATACTTSGIDECCTSSECTTGKCLRFPTTPYCGGAAPQEHNVCAEDLCQSSVQCSREGQGLCIPAGALGYQTASCIGTYCVKDTDCTDAAGGTCVMLRDPCCGAPTGLVCSYPPKGCRTASDCPDGFCGITTDPATGKSVAQCQSGPIACPA